MKINQILKFCDKAEDVTTGNEPIYYRIYKKLSSADAAQLQSSKQENLSNLIADCMAVAQDGEPVIYGTKLREKLFPTPSKVIFISHLHAEAVRAKKIKNFIQKKVPGYQCFIDSEVWKYADDAVELLERKLYVSKKVRLSTETHDVIRENLMLTLSMALTEAIRYAAAFVYIPNQEGASPSFMTVSTESPWICQELLVSSLIPEATENSTGLIKESKCELVRFIYEAPVDHLKRATAYEFTKQLMK